MPVEFLATLRADIRRTYAILPGSRLRRALNTARTPGVHAVVVYRFGQWLREMPIPVRVVLESLYYFGNVLIHLFWGIELPREAKIGAGLRIGHFGGITVTPLVVMGRNCSISQNVTIGVNGYGANAGAPVIGDDVYIAAGARIFGRIRIGNNVKIGANAVIYRDVPDNAVCALDPGFRILSFKGNRRPLDRAA